MSKETDSPGRLQLADLIGQVRSEIMTAMRSRETAPGTPAFAVEQIELKINFVVEKTGTVSGKGEGKLFGLFALEAGAEKKHRTEQVHQVEIKLKPFANPAPVAEKSSAAGSSDEPSPDSGGGKSRRASDRPLILSVIPNPGGSSNTIEIIENWKCPLPGQIVLQPAKAHGKSVGFKFDVLPKSLRAQLDPKQGYVVFPAGSISPGLMKP